MESISNMIIPSEKYKIHNLKCWETEISQIEFINLIKNMDLIVMQSIENDYRDKTYLSSTYIINNSNATTEFIIITNLYFPYYYFDSYIDNTSTYLYEYKHLKECKSNKNKSKIDFLKDVLFNNNFKTLEELKILEDYCFENLEQRLEIMNLYKEYYSNKKIEIINFIPFIKDNFKNKLLFNSLNHPSKDLLCEVCKTINYKINNMLEFDYTREELIYYKGLLYACLQKTLNFDILNIDININTETNIITFINNYFK
jgi:hypothetical protein